MISYADWLCWRFNLSKRNIDHAPVESDTAVSKKVILLRCVKLGAVSRGDLFAEYFKNFSIDTVQSQ